MTTDRIVGKLPELAMPYGGDLAAISKARKNMPLFDGFLLYFPDACLAIAEFSRMANEKHNPGEPLHWSKDKSKDHADCIGRHLLDIGPKWDEIDPEFGSYHATALAWRALALLQTVIERGKPPVRVVDLEWVRADAERNGKTDA